MCIRDRFSNPDNHIFPVWPDFFHLIEAPKWGKNLYKPPQWNLPDFSLQKPPKNSLKWRKNSFKIVEISFKRKIYSWLWKITKQGVKSKRWFLYAKTREHSKNCQNVEKSPCLSTVNTVYFQTPKLGKFWKISPTDRTSLHLKS